MTASKRVLLVVSSYKPALSASMHRVRMLAWYLRQHGWDFEILSPATALQQQVWIDPDAPSFFAPDASVTEAPPMAFAGTLRRAGVRGLSWQALFPIYNAGSRLLREKHFDLVFFSTTAFNLFCLGPIWHRRFRVPYILDFQDPWFKNEPSIQTTKHVWKDRIGNFLSNFMEGYAVNDAAGLMSVSPHYLRTLEARYPGAVAFHKKTAVTIPFGGLKSDFTDFTGEGRKGEGPFVIGYVGAGGVIMERSFERICRSLARLRESHPDLVTLFRIRLAGTDGGWTEGGRKILKNKADALGIGDLVSEDPAIISYSRATAAAASSDGLLVLGVDEPAYMASKLFSYACLSKPLLACIHEKSQMNDYFVRHPELGMAVHFALDPGEEIKEDAKILEFLNQIRSGHQPSRAELLEEHSAAGMTLKITEFFDKCVTGA